MFLIIYGWSIIHPWVLNQDSFFEYFKGIKVDGGIECEPCDGRGWLICDFCKGQKTNVKSENNRIYRRCPSCRAVSNVFFFWIEQFIVIKWLLSEWCNLVDRLGMCCVPSAKFSNVLLSLIKVMAKTETFWDQCCSSIVLPIKMIKKTQLVGLAC